MEREQQLDLDKKIWRLQIKVCMLYVVWCNHKRGRYMLQILIYRYAYL